VVFAVEKQCVLREVKQGRTISTHCGTKVFHSSISNSKQELSPAIRDKDKGTDRPVNIFKINFRDEE
jgi:hypothetical protein